MKIALSSSGNELNNQLDLRFGRSPYFLIYDLDTYEYKSVNNKGESSAGGAGIAAAQQLVNENVEAVITGSIGPNAYELLNGSSVKIYKGKELSCKLLIDAYKKGELEEIKSTGPSHRGGF